jgi:peptidoglycan/xylan/chitin deacetylase (PgdA/CDA1 family)
VTATARTTTRPTGAAVTISRGQTTDRVVALTYDAGADRGLTPQLLAYLEQADVKVTFGMTGRWAESNPDLVRLMAVSGDEFINHTYDHKSFTGYSAKPAVSSLSDRLNEIAQTDTIIQNLTGLSPRPFFRPPYGDQDNSVLQAVGEAGYRYSILWTVDTGGWRGIPEQQIVDRALSQVQPGAIYVLHVGGISHDIEATPAIVDGLRSRGYRFVTITQLLGLPPESSVAAANGG